MGKRKYVVKLKPNGDLVPANNYDRELIVRRYAKYKDVPLMVHIVKPRSVKHNAKYWCLMYALSYHFGNTDDDWHQHFKRQFLPVKEFYNPLTGTTELHVASTAFDRLDQAGFDEYYQRVDRWLLDRGYDVDELIETAPRGAEGTA